MGLSAQSLPKKVISLSLSVEERTTLFITMVDNVETTTPTVEEVAAPASDNGEAEAVTQVENGANGTTKEETETKEAEVESTNGATEVAEVTEEKEEKKEEAVTEETEEATKRKADAPSG